MSAEEYSKEKLWQLLIETVHTLVMYSNHKAYIRDNILPENPKVKPAELAARLSISLGEALVIMYELNGEKSLEKP